MGGGLQIMFKRIGANMLMTHPKVATYFPYCIHGDRPTVITLGCSTELRREAFAGAYSAQSNTQEDCDNALLNGPFLIPNRICDFLGFAQKSFRTVGGSSI